MRTLPEPEARDRLIVLAEHLASLHASPDVPWLTARFAYLGERALGSVLAVFAMVDQRGSFRAVAPSSPGPVVARQLWIQLDIANLASNLAAAAAFGEVERGSIPAVFALDRVFPGHPVAGGADQLLIAPALFERELIGMCLFVAPVDSLSERLASILADHMAVAVHRLRILEEGRRLHSIDPVLWIPDEQFLLSALRREVSRARRYGRELGLTLLRLKNEAQVREGFGGFFTDHLLRRIGSQIIAHVRDSDIVGALDGAFGVVQVETSPEGTVIAGQRVEEAVRIMTKQRFPELPAPEFALATAAYPLAADSAEGLVQMVLTRTGSLRAA